MNTDELEQALKERYNQWGMREPLIGNGQTQMKAVQSAMGKNLSECAKSYLYANNHKRKRVRVRSFFKIQTIQTSSASQRCHPVSMFHRNHRERCEGTYGSSIYAHGKVWNLYLRRLASNRVNG